MIVSKYHTMHGSVIAVNTIPQSQIMIVMFSKLKTCSEKRHISKTIRLLPFLVASGDKKVQ